jgi:hypothetical protein
MLRLAQRAASVVSCRPAWCRAPDCEVPERGRGPWPGSGADCRIILAVKDVTQPVQRPNRPLAADEAGRSLGTGAGRVEAGDPGAAMSGSRLSEMRLPAL